MALFSRILKWLVIIFISINLIIWSLSSPVIKHFLTAPLAEQGLRLSNETSIRFNPFITRLSIKNLQLLDVKTNNKTLAINQLSLQLALHQLFFDIIKIQKFTLDGFYIETNITDKNIVIAGVNINNNKSQQNKDPEQKPAEVNFQYQLILPKLQLTHGDISVTFEQQHHHINIDKLELLNTLANAQSSSTQLSLNATIDQANTALAAELKQHKDEINVKSTLTLTDFSLENIAPHLLHKIPQLTQLSGQLSLQTDPVISINNKAVNIQINKTQITPNNVQLALHNNDKYWQIKELGLNSQLDSFSLFLANKQKKSSAAKPQFSFAHFTLTMDKALTFIDKNFKNELQRSLQINAFTIGELNNTKVNNATPVSLKLTTNKYATLDASGSLSPFATTPSYNLNAELKELSLPTFSPYVEQAAGFSLQSGQLNNHLTLALTGDKIEGKTNILIKGLATSGVNDNEVNLLQDNATMPLNMALNVLKDDRDNVELEVPLSGLTSDPKFGLNSLFALVTQKAIWSATKAYAIKTFLPYANVMSVALTAGDFLLKTRFTDLAYQPTQITPNHKQQAYLDNFVKLMNNKKELTVKVCAISVAKDLNNKNSKLNKPQLKSIAEQRGQAFKDYMLKQGNISSNRLLLCAPQIDLDKNAIPRIELSI